MSANRHSANRLFRGFVHVAHSSTLALLLCIGLAGCSHKIPRYTIPAPPEIQLEPADMQSGGSAPVIAPEPPPDFGPLPPVNPPAPPQRRRPGPKEETVPPAPAAGEPAPADLAIGSLSTGLDAMPQIQQQAHDMIASILKRIAALSARTAESQKREVRQVRHFVDQAQQAINTGDTEGAKNLATKAGLLMDDLEKK